MNYTTRSFQSFLLPSCSTISTPPCNICTPCARVYRVTCISVSPPQMDRALSGPCQLGPVNYRDVSRSYFHSNGGGLTRSWQTRSLIISWQSRKSREAHSHTFHSTHKYGCYLLIRTRFALYVPTNSISSNLPSLLISPYIHVIRVYTYISLISTFVFPLILPPFIFRWWPFRTGHQNDCTSEKSVTILRKYSLLYTEHNLYIKRNLFRSSFFSSIQKVNDLGWF